MNVNGTGWRIWIVGIVGVLVTAGIVAAVRDSGAQRAMKVQVDANKAEIEYGRGALEQIPVMAVKIENIEERLDVIQDDMETNQTAILEAIENK